MQQAEQHQPPQLRKAAVLISTLDRKAADDLLERMEPAAADCVRRQIMEMGDISPAEQQQVISEFMRSGGSQPFETSAIALDSSLANRFTTAPNDTPHTMTEEEASPAAFRFLHHATPEVLARHLEREHPQIIAVVIVHLPPARAADLIKRLPERLQVDVLRRVAELDQADPQVLRNLEQQLESLLSDDLRTAHNRSAGLAAVAGILSAAGVERRTLLQRVAKHDRELVTLLRELPSTPSQPPRHHPQNASAQSTSSTRPVETTRTQAELRSESPPPRADNEPTSRGGATNRVTPHIEFEDLFRLGDPELATLLRKAGPQLTLLALAGADESLLARIVGQLPSKEADSFRRRMERIGPVRLADIEQAQRALVRLAAQLAERGEIQLPATKRFAMAA